MLCPHGHEMVAESLRRERECAGCFELTGTVYDCESGCFGECPECAKKIVPVPPADSGSDDGEA